LPPLPGKLRAIEVAYARKWDWRLAAHHHEPLVSADLTTAAKARLLARAQVRARRIAMSERHAAEDWTWVACELALVLPTSSPKIAEQWAPIVRRAVGEAHRAVDRLAKLEALVLAHEPSAAGWLRRQLGTLTPREREP
jgi:hypothetical protein